MTALPEGPDRRGRSSESVRIVSVTGDQRQPKPDVVVVEEPLRIHVRSGTRQQVLGTTMRTPGHDVDLSIGLAVGEGVIRSREDVLQVRPCHRDDVDAVTIQLRPEVALPDPGQRVGTLSSACGVCGREAIEALVQSCPPLRVRSRMDADVLLSLPQQMSDRQRVFRRTGGLHAAGVADGHGHVHTVREDVGRHNAVDKAVGASLLTESPRGMLVVSGRAGFEILQKAAMAGIAAVVSVSAPTSLAVDLARSTGILLAGFVRDGRMNVYAGAECLV